MTPVIAIVATVTSIMTGWIVLLSPLFRLHSRLDVTDYRIKQMESEIQEIREDLKTLLKRST